MIASGRHYCRILYIRATACQDPFYRLIRSGREAVPGHADRRQERQSAHRRSAAADRLDTGRRRARRDRDAHGAVHPEGGTGGYTVVLTSQSTAEVTVEVNVPAGADLSVDRTSLTFTAAD